MQPFLSTHPEINVPKPGATALRINNTKAIDSEQSGIASWQLPSGENSLVSNYVFCIINDYSRV